MRFFLVLVGIIWGTGSAVAVECQLGGTKFFKNSSAQQAAIIAAGGSCNNGTQAREIVIKLKMKRASSKFCRVHYEISNNTNINFKTFGFEAKASDVNGQTIQQKFFWAPVRPMKTVSPDRLYETVENSDDPCDEISAIHLYDPYLEIYDHTGKGINLKSAGSIELTATETYTADEFYSLISSIVKLEIDTTKKVKFSIE